MSEGTPPPYGDKRAMVESILADVKRRGDILVEGLNALPEKIRCDEATALIQRLQSLVT